MSTDSSLILTFRSYGYMQWVCRLGGSRNPRKLATFGPGLPRVRAGFSQTESKFWPSVVVRFSCTKL